MCYGLFHRYRGLRTLATENEKEACKMNSYQIYFNECTGTVAENRPPITEAARRREENMKHTFSFKEINYGSITIESDHEPDECEVENEIMKGSAYFDNTQYEDIELTDVEQKKMQPAKKRGYERPGMKMDHNNKAYDTLNLTPRQAKAVLAEKHPLDYLYREWIKTDCSYLD